MHLTKLVAFQQHCPLNFSVNLRSQTELGIYTLLLGGPSSVSSRNTSVQTLHTNLQRPRILRHATRCDRQHASERQHGWGSTESANPHRGHRSLRTPGRRVIDGGGSLDLHSLHPVQATSNRAQHVHHLRICRQLRSQHRVSDRILGRLGRLHESSLPSTGFPV